MRKRVAIVAGIALLVVAAALTPVFMFPGDTLDVTCVGGRFELSLVDNQGDGFVNLNCLDHFRPAPTATATPTLPPPTFTPTPTDLPTATPTPTTTATMPPAAHDVTFCHSEVIDGHSHGLCFDDLPEGPIKTWLRSNPDWTRVGVMASSGLTENLHPYPEMGKHVGFNFFYQEFSECHRFVNATGGQSPGPCVKAMYHQPHSVAISEAMYTPGSNHSDRMIVLVCEEFAIPGTPQCNENNVVAVAAIMHFGEVHNAYKRDFCEGLEGGIRYPNPGHHLDQPPYVAVRSSARNIFLWSNLTNSLMQSQIGPVNQMLQTAWSERVWESPSAVNSECGISAFDVVLHNSTADGFQKLYWVFTIKIDIDELPRPFNGFTDRTGALDMTCAAVSFDCLPIMIGDNVPAGDVLFNRAVNERDTEPLDITVPGITRPGS